jgi:hypothetical protein
MRYLNMKTVFGIETIDELNPANFESYKLFRQELKRLLNEYRIAGMAVYISQRSTNDWRHNQ